MSGVNAQVESGPEQKLRILHVVPYFPPDRIGGVGTVVSYIHHGLKVSGHQSRVLTAGSLFKDIADVIPIARSPAGFVLNSWRYSKLVREADVVHFHHGEALGLVLAIRLLRIRTPTILTVHVSVKSLGRSLSPFRLRGYLLGTGDRMPIFRRLGMRVRTLLDWSMASLVEIVCFISKSAASDVMGPGRTRMARVIYNGVPPAQTTSSPVPIEPVELLFVGTYSNRKRVLLLPFVMAEVKKRRPTCRIRVIGFNPEQHPELLRLLDDLGLRAGFVFEGVKTSEELPPFYCAAKVLLVPSVYEGLPMVILEAFQYGLPVVATRISGHPEVVADGENGYLVPLDDPEGMASAALRILEDSQMGEQMGACGRAAVRQHFSIDRQLREYLELYRFLYWRRSAKASGPLAIDRR